MGQWAKKAGKDSLTLMQKSSRSDSVPWPVPAGGPIFIISQSANLTQSSVVFPLSTKPNFCRAAWATKMNSSSFGNRTSQKNGLENPT